MKRRNKQQQQQKIPLKNNNYEKINLIISILLHSFLYRKCLWRIGNYLARYQETGRVQMGFLVNVLQVWNLVKKMLFVSKLLPNVATCSKIYILSLIVTH